MSSTLDSISVEQTGVQSDRVERTPLEEGCVRRVVEKRRQAQSDVAVDAQDSSSYTFDSALGQMLTSQTAPVSRGMG